MQDKQYIFFNCIMKWNDNRCILKSILYVYQEHNTISTAASRSSSDVYSSIFQDMKSKAHPRIVMELPESKLSQRIFSHNHWASFFIPHSLFFRFMKRNYKNHVTQSSKNHIKLVKHAHTRGRAAVSEDHSQPSIVASSKAHRRIYRLRTNSLK